MSFLIAGYKKARYDEKALCRAMGGLMFALAACFVVMAINDTFYNMVIYWIGFALFILIAIGGVIYINTSKKVKRK